MLEIEDSRNDLFHQSGHLDLTEQDFQEHYAPRLDLARASRLMFRVKGPLAHGAGAHGLEAQSASREVQGTVSTHLGLIVFEAPEAEPAHRLASVAAALAASGMVDPTSWSVETVCARGSPSAAETNARARREGWKLELGQRIGTDQLLKFLAATDERGLGLEVDMPITRCRLQRRERWWLEW
ncbi:hypothetical protein [Cystobacter ferrugineus]|nr:hypothetical protein [Cystobacter ferrugineus]